MAIAKSPFLVYQNFISAKQCETIVDDLGFFHADTNVDGDPIKMMRHYDVHEEDLFMRWQTLVPEVFKHFGAEYRGTEKFQFEFLAEGTVSDPNCDNSQYLRKKWVRTKDRDFTGILFLNDYSDTAPFDTDYEVYGGKLEFPQHGFGFNPERGTLIVFPAVPHFIYANAPVIAGDLHQVKFHVAAGMPYLYQPADFPGDFKSWFTALDS